MLSSSKLRGIATANKRRFLKRDREGVASTVGTIMALLVFLTFLGLFTNTYIPLWMLDNERNHMNEAMNEFGEFKSKIDSLIINAQITGSSEIIAYTPITLGAEGVPVFASPTAGQLSYEPMGTTSDTGVLVEFHDEYGAIVNESGGGKLELYAPNRYYVQQWLAYENGAIIVQQVDGQAIRAHPSISVQKTGAGDVRLEFTQINLIGLNSTVGGTGSVGINIDLEYLDRQIYEDLYSSNSTVTITFTTKFNSTWSGFLASICEDAGLERGTDFYLNETEFSEGMYRIVFTIENCGYLAYNRAYVTAILQS